MTIQQIIDEIITEIGGDADDSELDGKVLVCLKSGLRRIPAFIKDRLFLAQGSVSLTTGNYEVSLSAMSPGFVKERAIWYVGNNNMRVPIIPAPSKEFFHSIITINSTGKPSYYRIYGKTMQFNIKASSTLTIGLDYFKEVSSVVVGDTFFGNEQTVEAVKDYCKMIYYSDYEEDMEKSLNHDRMGKELIVELQREYEEQELGSHALDTGADR